MIVRCFTNQSHCIFNQCSTKTISGRRLQNSALLAFSRKAELTSAASLNNNGRRYSAVLCSYDGRICETAELASHKRRYSALKHENLLRQNVQKSNLLSLKEAEFDGRRLMSDNSALKSEKILTVPNLLCLGRIVVSPYVAHLIVNEQNFSLALGLFCAAGITDLLDGYIARRFPGQASSFGSFLDPLADKILASFLFVSLSYAGIFPMALTSLVVSRDFLLIYAGFYIRYMSVPPPFTLKKYFDISLPTAQVNPTMISKVNTVFQFSLCGVALGCAHMDLIDHNLFQVACGLTALTTFASAVSYAFMRDTYKFAHRSYDHQFAKKLAAFIFFCGFNLAFAYYYPIKSTFEKNSNKDV